MQRIAPRLSNVLALPLALLVAATLAPGHAGDPHLVAALSDGLAASVVAIGPDGPASAAASEAVHAIIQRAGRVSSSSAPWHLPPGTQLDRLAWDGNVLEIDLTLPVVGTEWHLGANDLETLSRALGEPFAAAPHFAGTRIRVRQGRSGEYGTLETLLPEQPAPAAQFGPSDADWPVVPLESPLPPAGLPPVEEQQPVVHFGGSSAQAARQPVGALSGVVVYVTAGHGWTAGTSSWFLQRPILFSMNEDYGNIDVINYFAAFAHNAGATVVPLRPVGWQPIEVVLDQDDPGVTFTGPWTNGSSSKYYENGVTLSGVVYRTVAASTTETATARYTPVIPVTDYYPVYCFTIAGSNRSVQTYRIKHSGGISTVAIDHREVGNGWIWLGDYHLAAGGDNYVEITNQSNVAGAIIADAIRWGGGTGDIVRPGPNQVSGYPRDEEAQRYWGQSEWGNRAVGFDSTMWDLVSSNDQSDNVGAGARLAREMNVVPAGGVQVDRWKRVHLEFHTNASSGAARGQVCLITDLGATTNQVSYATILSNEIDADLSLLSPEFEHSWFDRAAPTLTGSYGAIATSNNSNEFDATLVELAFHDNEQDARLLRDPRVRRAMARACVHGITRFLNTLAGSPVPLAFAPDTPRNPRVLDLGGGNISVAWDAPLSNGAVGDPATGYVIYRSSNGYGFGNPIVVGNVTSVTLTGVPAGQTIYLRIAATNAGGESMPTETLAVRRPSNGSLADVLVVNGYDRMRRQTNPIQTLTQPPAYAGQSMERVIWRKNNSLDYIVQHAESLAAADVGFVSCANEAVISGAVGLSAYEAVVWILGRESTQDRTFDATEQSLVTAYLTGGGSLFVSGSELAWDLGASGNGPVFLSSILRVSYSADDANTYLASGVAGSIFADLGTIDFGQPAGAPYDASTPDVFTASFDAQPCLIYSGGTGGIAAIQYSGGGYRLVVMGFPFEAIGSATSRDALMERAIDYLLARPPVLPFDFDGDGDVDIDDFYAYEFCCQGPDNVYGPTHLCVIMDGDGDLDVDLADAALFQVTFTGPGN